MCGAVNANSDLGGLTRYKSLVVKFDIDANIIWSKMYDTLSPFTGIGQIHEFTNGNILLAGGIDTSINYNALGPIKMKLYKIDKHGNLKWQKYIGSAYTYSDSEYPRSMNQTTAGGFILSTALIKSPSVPPRPYSIIKIDSTGCDTLEAYCKWVESLGISELYKLKGFDLEFFPNPAWSFVNIKVGAEQSKVFTIKLSDAEGKDIETKELRGGENLSLDIDGYTAGVYFISLRGDGKSLANRKLIIMR